MVRHCAHGNAFVVPQDGAVLVEGHHTAVRHQHLPFAQVHQGVQVDHTQVRIEVRVIDSERTRIGIRRFEVNADGLRINGEKLFLRGTNRHQDYPYVGYALSDDAQHRDARLIKEAGFDYIRLSHYLHAPAFMDACDELGICVMNAIPGWQYFNRDDPAFTTLQYENVRRMIRRDRNHACVLLWETSLNETMMPPEFIARLRACIFGQA